MAKNCEEHSSTSYLYDMKMTIQDIAEAVNGKVEGNASIVIHGPSKIEEGEEGTISFLGNMKYERYIYSTEASAVLVDKNFQPKKKLTTNLIRVDNVYEAVGELLKRFEASNNVSVGVDSTAKVDKNVEIGSGVAVGAFAYIGENSTVEEGSIIHPQVYIGPNVSIGRDTVIYPGVRIMQGCQIGNNCIIHPNAVIGSDGFGFAQNEQGHFTKVSQTGNVILEDEVEIGAAATIDRASLGSTIIHKGVKIDNQVQIAHNVKVGSNTAIAAQAGIAGSSKIGENCLVGGQAGIVGHIEVDDGTQIQAQSGVAASTRKKGRKLYGSPALDYNDYLRSYVIFSNMPKYLKKIRDLEARLEALEQPNGKSSQ